MDLAADGKERCGLSQGLAVNFLSGSGARVIGGSTPNTFFDFGGLLPAIYNNSGQTQSINFKIINGNSNGANRLELNADSTTNANSNFSFGGAMSASGGNRTVAVMGTGNTAITGAVTQETGATLALNKEGSGTLTLSNASNNYTGSTSISGGVLEVSGSGAPTATSGISVSGGTLLLSGNSSDRVNNAATISLGGGSQAAIQLSGAITENVGAMTLSSGAGTRVIDFGMTSGVLTLASLSSAASGLAVQIWNWSGTAFTGGGTDRLIATGGFSNSNITLSNITFFSGSGGGTSLGTAMWVSGTAGELVPVPEPGALLAGLAMLAPLAWRERRHWMRCQTARA